MSSFQIKFFILLFVALHVSAQSLCPAGQFFNEETTTCNSCSSALSNCSLCTNSSICLQCAPNYTWNKTSYQCVLKSYALDLLGVCPTKYYFNFTTFTCNLCSQAISNCSLCTNNTICLKCAPNYIWNNTSFECVLKPYADLMGVCPKKYYFNFTTFTCNLCSQAISNCSLCTNSSICLQCAPNYIWNNTSFECVLKPYADLMGVCPKKYYFNFTTFTCNLCSQAISNCSLCTNSSICLQCAPNYIWNNTSFECVLKPYADLMGVCPKKYYFNFTTFTCNLCSQAISNCSLCTNSSICLQCAPNYIWNNTSFECVLKPYADLMGVCPKKYYFNFTTFTCNLCSQAISNCSLCTNSSICLQCAPNYIWNNTSFECVLKPYADLMGVCPKKYYFNFTTFTCNLCSQAISNCSLCTNSSICLQCAPNYIWNNTSFECVLKPYADLMGVCPKKYYFNFTTFTCNLCSQAISNCSLCTNSSICLQCAPNYIWNNTSFECVLKPYADLMGVCPKKYYFNFTTFTCNLCSQAISNCSLCTNNTICLKCAPNYIWNNTSFECVLKPYADLMGVCPKKYYFNFTTFTCNLCSQAISNCSLCTNSSICLQCAPNYIWNNTSFECVLKHQAFDLMGVCPKKYYFNFTTFTCNLCSQAISNCSLCTNSSICLQCAPNYIWNNSIYECVLKPQADLIGVCPAGYYFNFTTFTCNLCSQALDNCTLCTNNTICLQCAPNYTWNQTLYQCQENSLCPSKYYYDYVTATCNLCSSTIAHCVVCSNGTKCTQCKLHYSWHQSSGKCISEFLRK